MTHERAKLIAAIDCCIEKGDLCDICPMMTECCDIPFTPFTEVPVQLLEAVRREISGNEGGKIQ